MAQNIRPRLSIKEKKTTYGKLWTSLCQYPELLGQTDVEYSRFVCNYSSPGYRIFILTTPGSEQANAATSKGAVHLLLWKHSNRSICWTAQCLPWPRLDSASCSTPFPGSSTESRGSTLSREARHLSKVCQVSSRSESFLRRASRATSSCHVALSFRRVSLTFGILTQMTKVYPNDWKVATRSCPDRRLFIATSLTS